MALPDLSLRRPVATAMLFVAVGGLGVVSFLRLPIDLLPDVAFPTLSVWTRYRDAGPAEVERFLSQPIERELSQVPGVRGVTSRSREGQSLVRLRFDWGTEMEFAALHVRERLDNLRDDLPRDSDRSVILRSDPTGEAILTIAVGGADLRALRELSETVFKRRLEQLDGVALAAVSGGPEREVRVVVDPERLMVHGLRLEEIAGALDAANWNAGGGMIRRGRFYYSLRTLGQFTSLEQIGDVVVARPEGGSPILLRDVASVVDTVAERETVVRYNGEPSVGLRVHKEAGSNTVRVADRVAGVLSELEREFPELSIEVASSQAAFIRDAISNVVQALLLGGALAFLVLFLFLRDPRYPVAVGVAIPISILAAFALCYLFDVSLNIMSLGGLALGVGLLVDNSIVVLENISRHREEEARRPEVAAAVGAREVTAAITASTLTTIAVFGPLLYVKGVAGALFTDLSLAVTFSLLASLLVALTLLPVLAARAARSSRRPDTGPSGGPSRGARFLDRFDAGFRRFALRYERWLEAALEHRTAVLGLAAAGLAFVLVVGGALPRSLMPRVDERQFRVELELPMGTPLATTERAAVRLERILSSLPGAEGVFSRVGRAREAELLTRELGGLNSAALEVRLAPGGPATARIAERFRERLATSGVDPRFVAVEMGRATSLGRALALEPADLAVEVQGHELEDLVAVAESAAARLRGLPRLADVRIDLQLTQPEIEVRVDQDAAARHGLTVSEVADAIEAFLRGRKAEQPYAEFADRVTIRVMLPEEARRQIAEVLRLRVDGVPLGELVEVRPAYGPVEIRREDQNRTVQVLAEVRDGGLDAAVEEARRALSDLAHPSQVGIRVAGENEEMRRSFRSLLFAFGLALFLVYLILAAQFESVIQPLVILAAVPLAAIGAVSALALAGHGLNVMSGIGLVILIGIVVNDAIIKVDLINRQRAAGRSKRTAILEAGRLRLRPIVMTTVTTVVGLLPLALGWGAGADLRAPLAVGVIGGLVSATALTLVVVPVLYSLLVEPGVPVGREAHPSRIGREAHPLRVGPEADPLRVGPEAGPLQSGSGGEAHRVAPPAERDGKSGP